MIACWPTAGDIREFYNKIFMPAVEPFVRSSIMGSSRSQGSVGPAGQPSSGTAAAPAQPAAAVIPAVAVEAEAALTPKATQAAARRAVLAAIPAPAAPGMPASAGKPADKQAMQQQKAGASPSMPAQMLQPLPPQALAIQQVISMDVDAAPSQASEARQQAVPARASPQVPASSPAAGMRRSIGAAAAAAGSAAAAAAAARALSPVHIMDMTRTAMATDSAQPGTRPSQFDQFGFLKVMPSTRPGTAGSILGAAAAAATPRLQARADSPEELNLVSQHHTQLPAASLPVSALARSSLPHHGAPPAVSVAPAAHAYNSSFKTPKSPAIVDADFNGVNGVNNKENALPHHSSMAAKTVAAAVSARKAASAFTGGRKGAGGSWLKSLAGGTGSGFVHLPSRFSIPGDGTSGMHSTDKQHLLHQRFQQHAVQPPGFSAAWNAASDFAIPELAGEAMEYQTDAQHVEPAQLVYSPLAAGTDAAAAIAAQAVPAGMLAMGSSPVGVQSAAPWALQAIMEEGTQRRPLRALSIAQANAFRSIR
jgi:hypothetical protein